MPAELSLKVRIVRAVADVAAADWDACANPAGATHPFDPFVSHAFLGALEDSGSVGARAGWLPEHLVVEDEHGRVLAVMPAYLKNHSQGEYVFDHGWAEAYEEAGGRYYPKLQVSVPFTPVTGRRLLARPGAEEDTARRALAAGMLELCRRAGASSVHVTFPTQEEWDYLETQGFLKRADRQFHWRNQGYADFEAFLDSLASRKRKAIRRERREAVADGITIEHVTGGALGEAHWDAFFEFYLDTGARKWGQPYLNRRFFSLLGERLGEHVLLILAKREDRYVAGALNLIGGDALFGRNWGCVEDHPFLHFEVCYHQAIEFAIEHGLTRVEAGAQGAHKLARGYEPVPVYSAHWIADPGLARAVEHYLVRERRAVERDVSVLAEHVPYRRGSEDD